MQSAPLPAKTVSVYTSISQQVYDYVKEQITSGAIAPGEKISEQVIADALQTSRSPVREAIKKLASEGIIDYFPNRGAYAKRYTQKSISDSFKVRMLLECYAASHIDNSLREKYRSRMEYMRDNIRLATRAEYVQLDAELHELLIQLTGNETLLNLYRLLYSQITTFRNVSLNQESVFRESTRAHLAILDSLIAGDDERVLSVISKHLSISQSVVERYYEGKPEEDAI